MTFNKKVFLILIFLGSWASANGVVIEEGLIAFQNTLYPLLRTRCVTCHGDGAAAIGHSVSNIKEAYLNARDLTDFVVPTKSVFYKMVKKQHWLKDDPTQTGMTENEILDAIKQWWDAGEKNAVDSFQFQSQEILLPVQIPTMAAGQWQTLSWDFGSVDSTYKGCDFTIDIQQSTFETNQFLGSYRVKNPQVRCLNNNFRFTGLFVSVSDEVASFENLFQDSEAQSASSNQYSLFSNDTMILMQRRKKAQDTIKILIKKIEPL